MTNATFVYLLCSTMKQHYTKIVRADHEIKGSINLSQLESILPVSLKGEFLGLNQTFVYLLCPIMPHTQVCMFGQIGPKLSICPKKGFFGKTE